MTNNSDHKINYAADAKAKSLQLKPKKRQSNAFSRLFIIDKPKLDIDIVATHRRVMCADARNNKGRFRPV